MGWEYIGKHCYRCITYPRYQLKHVLDKDQIGPLHKFVLYRDGRRVCELPALDDDGAIQALFDAYILADERFRAKEAPNAVRP